MTCSRDDSKSVVTIAEQYAERLRTSGLISEIEWIALVQRLFDQKEKDQKAILRRDELIRYFMDTYFPMGCPTFVKPFRCHDEFDCINCWKQKIKEFLSDEHG